MKVKVVRGGADLTDLLDISNRYYWPEMSVDIENWVSYRHFAK